MPRALNQRLFQLLTLLLLVSVAACQTVKRSLVGVEEYPDPGPALTGEPLLGGDPTMKALAHDLDHLERHIDWFGSVTAKVPDVWGQARLTQYRDEFEKAMAPEVNNFTFVLNGSESRSDQAYFATATALSFAAQPQAPVIGRVTSTKGNAPNLVPTSQTVTQEVTSVATGTKTTTVTNSAPASAPAAPALVKPLDVPEPGALVSDADKVINRNPAQLTRLDFAGAKAGIGIEPTEYLAQKQRYLNFLHQLRRENEGDDTADSPGYSLNLIRVPVSVLPGKRTEVGFAAEITMTLTPVLGEDLLPMTFQNLLINDLESQLGFPLTAILAQQNDITKLFSPDFERFLHIITRLNDYYADPDQAWGTARADALLAYLRLPENDTDPRRHEAKKDRNALGHFVTAEMREFFDRHLVFLPGPVAAVPLGNGVNAAVAVAGVGAATGGGPGHLFATSDYWSHLPVWTMTPVPGPTSPTPVRAAATLGGSASVADRAALNIAGAKLSIQTAAGGKLPTQYIVPALSYANGLDNRTALPTSQLLDVYGPEALFDIAYAAQKSLQAAIAKQRYAHLPDVQAYLREESRAAYEFLKKNPSLWTNYCTEHLVQAIRSQQWDEVTRIRQAYRKEVALLTGVEQPAALRGAAPGGIVPVEFDPEREPAHLSRTTGLAWALIVDGALLTDRLIQDMKQTATSKGQPLPGCDRWCPYFLPDPPPECRRAFNDYVALRWPIHVFALDPYVQEQNIADSLSTRREMQLALAIAFTNGMINARQLTRYTRRLEAEYQTIALNRTQVGFSHGDNVFGWRFYPRFQTPDTRSNLQVLVQEQLIGGPNRDQVLRQRRLEPGWRECVAIVMMPSFVPYMTLDTVSNWFPITNPKHKVLDNSQAVKLSRTVQAIKNGGGGVKDANHYRFGEARRLMVRAEQLESRLPTQTLTGPVPILNTLGGFEMFSNGTTDLAPELFGWYGAPGIDPEADSTTLFLVGDHFSPLRTKVIVGNRAVDAANQTMLSRQVIQVTFNKGAYTVTGPDGGGEVRIHLATPYGVTRELAVPVAKVKPPAPAKTGFLFAGAKLTASYGFAVTEPGKFRPLPKGAANTDDLKITWNNPGGTLPARVAVEFVFAYQAAGMTSPATIKVPCQGVVVGAVTASEVVIPKPALDAIAADLVGQIAAFGPFPMSPNPLDQGLKTTSVTITPLVPAGVFAQGVAVADALAVEFKAEGVCPAPGPYLAPPIPASLPVPVLPAPAMPRLVEPLPEVSPDVPSGVLGPPAATPPIRVPAEKDAAVMKSQIEPLPMPRESNPPARARSEMSLNGAETQDSMLPMPREWKPGPTRELPEGTLPPRPSSGGREEREPLGFPRPLPADPQPTDRWMPRAK